MQRAVSEQRETSFIGIRVLKVESGDKGYVHVVSMGGHRDSYQRLLSEMFELKTHVGKVSKSNFLKLLKSNRVIFATIDDDYAGFFIISLGRLLFGRRTVGLFLRPSKCFESGKIIYSIKRWSFQFLRHLPKLSVLTILPFEFEQRFSSIAHGWVHDPQMWDLHGADSHQEPGQLSRDVLAKANGRSILCFLGSVRKSKGFDFLSDIFSQHPQLAENVLVVVAGGVDEESRASASRLVSAGGMLVDRFVSDGELMELYGVSDMVWCCYGPDYDQASGIFGRSIQLGKRPIVRKGALLEKYEVAGLSAPITLSYGDTFDAATKIAEAADGKSQPPARTEAVIAGWRADFVKKIGAAL